MKEKLKILVAIDEMPSELWTHLQDLAEFRFAREGSEAYHQLASQSFDLAFIDLNLMGMDSLELLRRIRSEQLCQYVILTSSVPSFSYAQQGILYGVSAYLLRPLNEPEVEKAIRKIWSSSSDSLLHDAAAYIVENLRSENGATAFAQAGEHILPSSSDTISTGICWRNLYLEVVNLVYLKCPWLKLYHQAAEFSSLDHVRDTDTQMVRNFCLRKVQLLNDILTELFPISNDLQLEEIEVTLLQSIDQNPQQKEIAERFYIANSTLSTRFQRHLGISYREYMTRLKIKRAQYLLRYTDICPGDIAPLLGYKDKDYFSKLFLQRTGQSLERSSRESWSDFHI